MSDQAEIMAQLGDPTYLEDQNRAWPKSPAAPVLPEPPERLEVDRLRTLFSEGNGPRALRHFSMRQDIGFEDARLADPAALRRVYGLMRNDSFGRRMLQELFRLA